MSVFVALLSVIGKLLLKSKTSSLPLSRYKTRNVLSDSFDIVVARRRQATEGSAVVRPQTVSYPLENVLDAERYMYLFKSLFTFL